LCFQEPVLDQPFANMVYGNKAHLRFPQLVRPTVSATEAAICDLVSALAIVPEWVRAKPPKFKPKILPPPGSGPRRAQDPRRRVGVEYASAFTTTDGKSLGGQPHDQVLHLAEMKACMRELHAKGVKITRLSSRNPTCIADLLGFSQRMGVAQDMPSICLA
jgi:hypothetical protein